MTGKFFFVVRMAAALRPMSRLHAEAKGVSSYFALPETARLALASLGIERAAPVQEAAWAAEQGQQYGAAAGESMCLHAPTGSGKTLAMLLPSLFGTFWSGRGKPGALLVVVPSRELVTQHARLAEQLLGQAPTCVTSSTTGDEAGLARVAQALETSRCVVATPRELCKALEYQPDLYVEFASRIQALVLDELDLLMPSRKYAGARETRWQDRGQHPTEGLAKLVAKRASEYLQVLAGSATLDKDAKVKLERCLKGSLVDVPLRVVTIDDKPFALESKVTERTTLIPRTIAHKYVAIPKTADRDGYVQVIQRTLNVAKPRNALVFVCSASGLKVRPVDSALRARGVKSSVLGDVLWPSSARNRRRTAHREIRHGREDNRNDRRPDAQAGPQPLTADAADRLAERLKAATRDNPCVFLADQAVTRGLHLDAVDLVIVVGQPYNADTYLHLAGRTGRDPLGDADQEGTVVTLATMRDLRTLQAWLKDLGTLDFAQFDLGTLPSRDGRPLHIAAPLERAK